MKLNDFLSNYKYVPDCPLCGWSIIKPNIYGIYEGDCEDFSLTIKYRVEGYKDLQIWFCRYSGIGHIVGRDPKTNKWIDNIQMRFVEKLSSEYTDFRKVSWIEMRVRMFYHNLLRLYHKILRS